MKGKDYKIGDVVRIKGMNVALRITEIHVIITAEGETKRYFFEEGLQVTGDTNLEEERKVEESAKGKKRERKAKHDK